jgi:hypothetical protein
METPPNVAPEASPTNTPAAMPPAPTASTPTGDSSFHEKIKALLDYWQLGAAVVALIAAIAGGLSYFASHHELSQLDCRVSQRFGVADLESRIAQLSADIQEGETELRLLTTSQSQDTAMKQLAEIQNKKIEDLRTQKREFATLLHAANQALSESVCSPSESKSTAEKK